MDIVSLRFLCSLKHFGSSGQLSSRKRRKGFLKIIVQMLCECIASLIDGVDGLHVWFSFALS